MTTNGKAETSHLLTGLVLGAIGGLTAAILCRKETREVVIERGGRSLDFLNRQAGKLRETADAMAQRGKKLMTCKSSEGPQRSSEAEKQAYQEERRENLGG